MWKNQSWVKLYLQNKLLWVVSLALSASSAGFTTWGRAGGLCIWTITSKYANVNLVFFVTDSLPNAIWIFSDLVYNISPLFRDGLNIKLWTKFTQSFFCHYFSEGVSLRAYISSFHHLNRWFSNFFFFFFFVGWTRTAIRWTLEHFDCPHVLNVLWMDSKLDIVHVIQKLGIFCFFWIMGVVVFDVTLGFIQLVTCHRPINTQYFMNLQSNR